MFNRTVVYFLLTAFIVLCSGIGVCSAAGKKAHNFSESTPLNAGLRSLLIPGWGQFSNSQKTKGYILGGTAIAGITAVILMYGKANDTYDKYEENGRMNDELYDDYKSQINIVNVVVGLSAAVWTYSVVDAYVSAPKSKELSLGIRNQQLCMNYKW